MSGRSAGKRILVVDDDALVLRVIVRVLEHGGRYRVQSFRVPADALQHLATEDYDLLITDLKMPGTDGLSLVAAARAHRPELPAILVTGHATDAVAERAKRVHVVLLRKPFSVEGLLGAIAAAVGEDARG